MWYCTKKTHNDSTSLAEALMNLKLVNLTVYIKSILARLLKNLNNVKLCKTLNASTLNFNHKIDKYEIKMIIVRPM
jgi:hypothetical protein